VPRVTLIGGPNGSGKSTLITELRIRGIAFGDYLNADEIARHTVGDRTQANLRAQAAVREMRAQALAENRDHAWETVMSHRSHLYHLLDARDRGYEVWVIYIATEHPLVNLLRVRERAARGGHDVPEERVFARYWRSLDNLPYALALSHFAQVFDNSDPDTAFRLLFEMDRGRTILRCPFADMPGWVLPSLQCFRREWEDGWPHA
jgi:predicted ABC-type ATPase